MLHSSTLNEFNTGSGLFVRLQNVIVDKHKKGQHENTKYHGSDNGIDLTSARLSACSKSDTRTSDTPSQSTTKSSPSKSSKPTDFDMQPLIGQKWSDAKKALSDKGWTALDYTVVTDNGKGVWDSSNWIVSEIKEESKPTFILKHNDSSNTESSKKPADPRAEALSQKLSTTTAQRVYEEEGIREYPRGFKPHRSTGFLQNWTPKDDNTWYYKAYVDIKDNNGVKTKDANYECSVTGTNENPQIVSFLVY